jgi:hypothetical protein
MGRSLGKLPSQRLSLRRTTTVQISRAAPSPIRANGPHKAGDKASLRKPSIACRNWIGFEMTERRCGQPGRGFGIDRPMRNARGAGVEERARQARQGFRAGLVAGDGFASRQDHPIGIELEPRDFARRQQAVVEIGRLFREAEHQRRLGRSLNVAGNQSMGGEIDDAVVHQRCALDRRFAGIAAQMDIAG